MTPGALRDWIPASLHGELDAVRVLVDRLLSLAPSPFVEAMPTHLLAAIEERSIAPWLGAALFLSSDPVGEVRVWGRGPRLYSEERDWNRHAVLLGDLTRRFGEGMRGPLEALPTALRPGLVADWLGHGARGAERGTPSQRVDRRIVEAERAIEAGDRAEALASLLRLWRETGDPLVADVIDVLDPLVGEAMGSAELQAFWARPGLEPEIGRALRGGALWARRDGTAAMDRLAALPRDPRIATAVRVALLTSPDDPASAQAAAQALARIGDVRGIPRLAWERFLPKVDASAMWTTPAGPVERSRLHAIARSVGGVVEPMDGVARSVRDAAWRSRSEDRAMTAAVLGDALRERGDACIPALVVGPIDAARLAALPGRAAEALLARPFGLESATAVYADGLLERGATTDTWGGDAFDPAWGAVRRLTVTGFRSQFVASLPCLVGVMVRAGVGATLDGAAAFLDEVRRQRAAADHPVLTELGDEYGLFAQIPGEHAAIVPRHGRRFETIGPLQGAVARHVAVVGALETLGAALAGMSPSVEVVTLVEGGVPLWAPKGWSVEVHRPSGRMRARWTGAGATGRVRTSLLALLRPMDAGERRAVVVEVPAGTGESGEDRRTLSALRELRVRLVEYAP
ncbi:MAG: hypothetical protein EXR69_00310 [Myxococcales bacterium]|nr:hypothetical protein [Myxococcales bacterium]